MSDIYYTDTVDFLIQQVKNRETIPDSGAAYSDRVILDFLNQSLHGYIVPAVMAVMDEYFVITSDVEFGPGPTGSSLPTNVDNWFWLPVDCAGNRLRDLYVIGNDGSFYNLPRLTPTQAAAQNFGSPWGPLLPPMNNTQFVGGFYMQGNQVQIFPYGLAANKMVRITYQQVVPDLCLIEDAAQVLSVDSDFNTLVVNTVHTDWHGRDDPGYNSSTGTRICAISSIPPYDYVTDTSVDQVVYTSPPQIYREPLLNVTGNVLTFFPGVVDNINPGDWICPVGKSVYALQLPRELYPALTQKAASMLLESAGDREGQQVAEQTFQSMMKMAIYNITPRVIGKPIKVLPTNSSFKASRNSGWGQW